MKAIFAVTILTVFVTFVHTSEAVTCPPENDEFVTLIPNPSDCTTFYICNRGIPYLMKCNPGLHFNPVEKVCDWPEHANCEQNPASTTELPEVSTVPETTPASPEVSTVPETTPASPETASPTEATIPTETTI